MCQEYGFTESALRAPAERMRETLHEIQRRCGPIGDWEGGGGGGNPDNNDNIFTVDVSLVPRHLGMRLVWIYVICCTGMALSQGIYPLPVSPRRSKIG